MWTIEEYAEKYGLDLKDDKVRAMVEETVDAYNDADEGRTKLRAKNTELRKQAKKRVSPQRVKAALTEDDDEALEGLDDDVAQAVRDRREQAKRNAALETEVAELKKQLGTHFESQEQAALRGVLEPHVNAKIREDLRPLVMDSLSKRLGRIDGGTVVVLGEDGEPITYRGKPLSPEEFVADLKTGTLSGIKPMPSAFIPDEGQESPRGEVSPYLRSHDLTPAESARLYEENQ